MNYKYIYFLMLLICSNSFSQNNEFRSYIGNEKNKFISTEKSNSAYNSGIDFFNNSDYNNAVKQFTITIEEDKKQNYLSTDAYLARASAYIKLNLLKNAISDYSVIIENEKDTIYLILAYVGRGGVYGFLNETEMGIGDFKNALKLNSNDVDAIFNLSRLYIQQKDNIKGLDALNLAEKKYNLQKLNNPLIICSILYMKGVAKYSLNQKDFCNDFNSSLKYKTYLVKEQIDFIRKVCDN
jgi:tetratricopeptide (TPR) repeat protein